MSLLKEKSLVITISGNFLSIVEMAQSDTKKGTKTARLPLAVENVKNGKILNSETLKKEFFSVVTSAKIDVKSYELIIFTLPERLLYTRVFTLPPAQKDNLRNLVEEELLKAVPLLVEERVHGYKIVESSTDSIKIVALAADKKVVGGWENFFRECEMKQVKIGGDLLTAGKSYQGFVMLEERGILLDNENKKDVPKKSVTSLESSDKWRLVLGVSIFLFVAVIVFFCWTYYPLQVRSTLRIFAGNNR